MSARLDRPFTQGQVLWAPPEDARERFVLGRYLEWLAAERGLEFRGYEDLHAWSVSDLEAFWASIWDFFEVRAHTPYERVLGSREMPGAEWFPGARLNFAEHMLGRDEDVDSVAVVAHSQSREPMELTFGDLREQVARARAGLQRLGVGPGDRVVAYLPNIPETLVAFLATASLGAIWATCPPEFGVRSVLHRLGQLEPKVLFVVAGYRYGEKQVDRREQIAAFRDGLPSLETVVHVPYGGGADDEVTDAVSWDELLAEPAALEFEPVPFAHPLYVLFSSGTTGLPKAIVHCHGGILLEHLKNHGFSWDLQPGDRLQWFTTTAWMMWNALVSTLLLRASIVMIDGNPAYPDLAFQWRLIEETKPTFFGLSPAFTMACRKEGLEPGKQFDLSSVRMVCEAGSPLPLEGYEWLYEQFGPDVQVNVGSGGTDVCTGIVQGYPIVPVYAGEMSARMLGADAAAFGPDGTPGRRRARRARDPAADAVDARRVLERPRRLPLPRVVLRVLPGRLALRRLDPVHRAGKLDDHGPLRRDAQPRRRAARDERDVLRRGGAGRGARQPRRAHRGARRASPVRRASPGARARRRSSTRGSSGRCATRSPRGMRRTRSSPCRRSRGR